MNDRELAERMRKAAKKLNDRAAMPEIARIDRHGDRVDFYAEDGALIATALSPEIETLKFNRPMPDGDGNE